MLTCGSHLIAFTLELVHNIYSSIFSFTLLYCCHIIRHYFNEGSIVVQCGRTKF